MTQTTTTINTEIIPQRISADHYQIPSFTTIDKFYNQHFDYDLKRWICDCPDTEKRHNTNCKHVIILRTFIKREKAQHSTSVELMSVLSRISVLEAESTDLSKALYAQNELIGIKDQQIIILQDRLRASEMREPIQQKQIDNQADLIGSLQTSVCRLNELTINQDTQIQKLIAAVEQQRRMIDDQTQQIDKLHEAISSQQKPVEQVVRVVIDQPQPAPRQSRQERQPSEDTAVKQVSKSECKVGKFTVRVLGNSAAGCDCSIGIMDRQCGHMVKVDQFLSK